MTYTVEIATITEVLREKLTLWELRAKYAKGARKAECERAITDLTAKLARASA